MKTIGLIGGMSFESTIPYYKIINEVINKNLGGLHSAKCILYSVDFDEIEKCQSCGDWLKSGEILGEAAFSLEKAGADFIIICTNTMHKVIDIIKEKINIPILHIAEVTAQKLIDEDVKKVLLLGTRYTMEQDFYKKKLIEKNIDVVIPDKDDIKIVDDIIFKELCVGIIKKTSKEAYLKIINKARQYKIQGVILGCTEIGLLINNADTDLKLFDTTQIHAESAALYALK